MNELILLYKQDFECNFKKFLLYCIRNKEQLVTTRHCNIKQSLADFTETLYRNPGIYVMDMYRCEN